MKFSLESHYLGKEKNTIISLDTIKMKNVRQISALEVDQ